MWDIVILPPLLSHLDSLHGIAETRCILDEFCAILELPEAQAARSYRERTGSALAGCSRYAPAGSMRISWDGEEPMDIPPYFFGNHTSYVVSEAASRLDQHGAISEASLDYERYRFGVHLYVHLMLNVFQQHGFGYCFSCG